MCNLAIVEKFGMWWSGCRVQTRESESGIYEVVVRYEVFSGNLVVNTTGARRINVIHCSKNAIKSSPPYA